MISRPATAAALVRRHLLVAVAVTVGVMTALVGIDRHLATAEADRMTRDAATRVAERLSSTLSATDFDNGSLDVAQLDASLDGFFAAGAVARIKVWRIEGDVARIVYSDERRLIGEERTYSSALADELARARVVVREVPTDTEHRFETGSGRELREAVIAFADADGTALRLEVYVPVFRDAWVASTLGLYVPVMIGGIAVLVLLLVPLSVRLARRLSDADHERRLAIDFGLRERERERLRLARRLHDDVLQNLAGSALALDALASAPDPDRLRSISGALTDDARTLRRILDGRTAAASRPLAEALQSAVASTHATGLVVDVRDDVRIDVQVDLDEEPDAEVSRLFVEATRELVRNARAHADATRIEVRIDAADGGVELSVTDDGQGFADGRTAASGHGLRLLDRAFADAGGTLEVSSSPSGTVVRARVLQASHDQVQSSPLSASSSSRRSLWVSSSTGDASTSSIARRSSGPAASKRAAHCSLSRRQ